MTIMFDLHTRIRNLAWVIQFGKIKRLAFIPEVTLWGTLEGGSYVFGWCAADDGY